MRTNISSGWLEWRYCRRESRDAFTVSLMQSVNSRSLYAFQSRSRMTRRRHSPRLVDRYGWKFNRYEKSLQPWYRFYRWQHMKKASLIVSSSGKSARQITCSDLAISASQAAATPGRLDRLQLRIVRVIRQQSTRCGTSSSIRAGILQCSGSGYPLNRLSRWARQHWYIWLPTPWIWSTRLSRALAAHVFQEGCIWWSIRSEVQDMNLRGSYSIMASYSLEVTCLGSSTPRATLSASLCTQSFSNGTAADLVMNSMTGRLSASPFELCSQQYENSRSTNGAKVPFKLCLTTSSWQVLASSRVRLMTQSAMVPLDQLPSQTSWTSRADKGPVRYKFCTLFECTNRILTSTSFTSRSPSSSCSDLDSYRCSTSAGRIVENSIKLSIRQVQLDWLSTTAWTKSRQVEVTGPLGLLVACQRTQARNSACSSNLKSMKLSLVRGSNNSFLRLSSTRSSVMLATMHWLYSAVFSWGQEESRLLKTEESWTAAALQMGGSERRMMAMRWRAYSGSFCLARRNYSAASRSECECEVKVTFNCCSMWSIIQTISTIMEPIEKVAYFGMLLSAWVALTVALDQIRLPRFKNLTPLLQNDIKNRVVSIVHGVLSLLASGYVVLFTDLTHQCENTFLVDLVFCLGSSYALVDTVSCYVYGIDHMGLYIHHSFMVFGELAALGYGYGGLMSMTGLFAAEITNPQMHLRSIVKALGLRSTLLYESLEVGYLVPYIFMRGIYYTYKVGPMLVSERPSVLLKCMMFGLYLQSLYYIVQMNGMIKKKIRQFREMHGKNIWYNWLTINPRLPELSFYQKKQRQDVF